MNKHKIKILIAFLTVISLLLHCYNLTWGAPFYFHPDERNIASSVSQLRFPQQMHPHFFAYGSLPIYSIYFTGYAVHFFQASEVRFEEAIVISRVYSAFFATLLIPLLFTLGKKIKNETVGLLAAFLATTSVGLIQSAHFGTFEMWLTFFTVVLFWFCIQKLTVKHVIGMGIVLGILIGTKVSSLALLPLPLLVYLIQAHKKHFSSVFIEGGLLMIIASVIYFLTNPFVLLDTHAFVSSMQYESSVVLGTLPVFYTGEFFKTTPVLFQFIHSYPFLLNPFVTILLIPALCYLIVKALQTKNLSLFLLFVFFSLLFLSQAFFFAKWTRYLVPTLPFIYLIIALGIVDFWQGTKKVLYLQSFVVILLFGTSCLFAFSYFLTVFVRPDTRIAASTFARKTIPPNASLLSEVYDLGIIPFNSSHPNIRLFHFYDLDNHSPDVTTDALQAKLAETEYIILPSQRILKTRLLNQHRFPQANAFYQNLLNGSLGYEKIYETPCDIFCNITYVGSPIFAFEETANVFDRPTVMIFKKTER